jgi:P4 family phage/plasmid primase-like protien
MTADNTYAGIVSFYKDYRQLFMNNVINININNITNYGNFEDDFTCDVKLDPVIIKDKKLRAILNECLDGHKVTKMAELMSMLYKDYVFTGNDWFFFDGHKYIADTKSINFKINILDLCKTFNKIKAQYEQQQQSDIATNMIKNIKSLTIKLNKPQLKDDIIKEAQLFYNDNSFISKLNSKKHLVPFNNGVFDLLENKFRKTKKDDYINFTVGFDYDKKIQNTEVVNFVNNILPKKGVRDFVLKKMSECLNGDIPNTNFLMFIGDGANGKSQLLNLMKVVMGEFGEKVEVTLLTRKRNNANEANTEKIKLLNKRFAFLSEPEDGEKINIGLLKELTGSEEIVARGLYQEAVSFVMEAKLFLACNELPEIKGEDTALWRRIRVIDFPSRFVDNPSDTNEYKIDRTLPSRMREDLTWRQTFMNMLLDYYNRDVPIPEEVNVKTNEYRQENSDFYSWLEENIQHSTDEKDYVELKMVCEAFTGKSKHPSRISSKYKKEIEKYVKEKYKTINHEYRQLWINGEKVRGWQFLKLNF